MHLSIVAPVPDAHLSFIDGIACLSPLGACLKIIILAFAPREFNDRPRVGKQVFDREGDGVDFLNELAAQEVRRAATLPTRSTNPRASCKLKAFRGNPVQECEHRFGLFGLMPLIILPKYLRALKRP